IGRSFALDILQAIVDAPDETVLDAVEEAEHAQLIASQPAGREVRYGFVHELIRTTLASSVSLPRRQRLHLKTADAIEQLRASSLDSHVSVLAHHLHQAGAAADRDRAAKFLSLAGCRAIDAAAFEEALELCDDLVGLELPDTSPLVAEAHERRGQAMRGLHRMLDASAEFERALDQYAARRDDDGVMRSASAAAACYRPLTRLSDAARVVRYGLSRLAPSALGQHALLRASLALQETVPSSLPAAMQDIADAEAMARRQNDPAVLARVL